MIEIIQQNEQKDVKEAEETRLPKNIRQIGNPEKDFRIYMEDYVYTFLHPVRTPEFQAAGIQKTLGQAGPMADGEESPIEAEEKKHRMIILLGDIETYANRKCAFISGAMQVMVTSLENGLPRFKEKDYEEIKAQQRIYFPSLHMVGWVFDQPGCTTSLSLEIQRVHADYMGEEVPFLFLMDSMEREETFYIYKEGKLQRKEGYFIYYEKNPDMQEYMVSRYQDKHKKKLEEANDRAAASYRSKIQEKQEKKNKRYRTASYFFGIAMTLGVCAICILVMGSLRKIESVEAAVASLTGKNLIAAENQERQSLQGESLDEAETETQTSAVLVEEVAGDVFPTEVQQEPEIKEEQTEITNEVEEEQKKVSEQAEEQQVDTSAASEETQNQAKGTESEGDSQEFWGSQPADEQPLTFAQQCLAQGYYIVQRGDSLEKICISIYQTDAMIDKICEVNQIDDPNNIYEGQQLQLP